MNHAIHLREPWQQTPVDGMILFSRAFGAPRQHDPEEKIWIVIESTPGPALIRLNEQEIGTIPPGADSIVIDVTPQLQPRNRLEISSVSRGSVRLEIGKTRTAE